MTGEPSRFNDLDPDEVHVMLQRKTTQLANMVNSDFPLMLGSRAEYRDDRNRMYALMGEIKTLLKRADEIIGETAG